MSLPNRRWMLLTPLALTACGFEPVYGPSSTGRILQNNVLVDAPSDEKSYLLTRELEERLGRSDAPRFALSLDITTNEQGLAINREGNIERFNLTGVATYALRDVNTGQIVTSGQVDNFTSYSATGTTVVTLASEQDALRRLMVTLADQIVTRLYTVDLAA